MPNYSKHGKIQVPIDPEEWIESMKNYQSPTRSYISKQKTLAFLSIIYYLGLRVSEVLKLKPENFTIEKETLAIDVGSRAKHSKRTPPLVIKNDLPFVDCIINEVKEGHSFWGRPLFPFTRMTGYNIVNRAFPGYPHFFRLSRITQLLQDGWTLPEVQAWTGLTLNALNYYVGLASIRKKGITIK